MSESAPQRNLEQEFVDQDHQFYSWLQQRFPQFQTIYATGSSGPSSSILELYEINVIKGKMTKDNFFKLVCLPNEVPIPPLYAEDNPFATDVHNQFIRHLEITKSPSIPVEENAS